MLKFLQEWCSARTTFSKATVRTKLARIKYPVQSKHEYVAECQSCSVQLVSMDDLIVEELLITMFTEFIWRPFEFAECNGPVSVTQKGGPDLAGTRVVIAAGV